MTDLSEKNYCKEEYFECTRESYKIYSNICEKYNIHSVVDIGCCYGFQTEFFKDMKYIGIDSYCNLQIADNADKVIYIKDEYPCDVPEADCFMSHLCVGYLCQITEQEIENLAKKFEYILIDNTHNNDIILQKYYVVEITYRCPYTDEAVRKNQELANKKVINSILYKRTEKNI